MPETSPPQRKGWRRGAAAGALLLFLLGLAAWSASAQGDTAAPDGAAYNLLTNDSMELFDPAYGQWYPWNACSVNKQVATGWHRFTHGQIEPAWLDAVVYANSCMGTGWVECIKGSTCQFIAGLAPYSAGIYQKVHGLTPGVGYGFHTVMMTLWQSMSDPVTNDRMFKQIGIDPTGGTDPLAPSVVWTEANGADKAWDLQQRISFQAQGTSATAFARIISVDPAYSWPRVNLSILDSAIFAQTPTVSASSPDLSCTESFWVSWDNVVLAPGAKAFRGCDVQWLDEAEGVWHDWQAQSMDAGATFDGQYGHTYRFRARAWQQYQNNAWLYGPYSATYDSRTQVAGPLAGRVVIPEGYVLWGAVVSVAETGQWTLSGSDGGYAIQLRPCAGGFTVGVEGAGWLSTSPAYGVSIDGAQGAALDWVLRPPGDAVVNGEFEQGLEPWEVLADQGVVPAVVAEPVHTGLGALELGGEAAPGHTVAVSQTLALTDAWEPLLSFLYLPAAVDAGDLFSVELTLVQEITPSQAVTTTWTVLPGLDALGWTHFWTPLGPPGAYVSGTLGIQFRMVDDGAEATLVYLDEVSAGATPGGPHRVYVPTAAKDE